MHIGAVDVAGFPKAGARWFQAWWLYTNSPLWAASRPPLPEGHVVHIVESNVRAPPALKNRTVHVYRYKDILPNMRIIYKLQYKPQWGLIVFHPIYLSTRLSVYLSIYLYMYLPIYLSMYLFIYPSIYLSIYLFIYLSIYFSV